MASVFLNGEEVAFAEGVPTDPAQVLALVKFHAESNNAIISEFCVDGASILESSGSDIPHSFERAEAKLVNLFTYWGQRMELCHGEIEALEQMSLSVSGQVLTKPWDDCQQYFGDLLISLKNCLTMLGQCLQGVQEDEDPRKQGVDAGLEMLGDASAQLFEYIQLQDAAQVSDLLAGKMRPALLGIGAYLSELSESYSQRGVSA